MVFWLAYSFKWDGDTIGVLGVLVSIFLYWDGIFGMVYFLHEMEHMVFGMTNLEITSQNI